MCEWPTAGKLVTHALMRSVYPLMSFTPAAILLVLAAVFIRRRLYSQFPFFCAYVTFSLIATVLRLLVNKKAILYFWLYWATEAAYSILALLALNEVFQRLYELEYEDHTWFKFLIPTTGAIVLGISVWEAIHNPPGQDPVPFIVTAIFWFDVGVHWLQAGILLLLLVLALFFALPRSRYEFGILGGFAVSAYVTLAADLARSQLGRNYESWFQYGPPLGYLVASLIWLYGFWRPPLPPARLNIKKMLPLDDFSDHDDAGNMKKIIEVSRLQLFHNWLRL